MPGFDVLDKDLNLFKSHFLEASAGTGKTFAIEHIVLRLLIAENGPTLDKILVVTFTKAATLELKRRIRKTLEKAMEKPNCFPFLEQLSERTLFLIKKKLLRALSLFDEAKIMTIHSFCHHCLVAESMDPSQTEIEEGIVTRMVKDYLRTECASWPAFQMDRLLRSYQLDLDWLIKDLLKIALKRVPIECGRTFDEQKKDFSFEMECLKSEYHFNSENLYEDLLGYASLFKGMSSKAKEIKEDICGELYHFSRFSEDFSHYRRIVELKEENALKKRAEIKFHYPGLLSKLQKKIFPILEEMQDDNLLFARLAEGIRLHLLKEKNTLFHDDLLLQMAQKTQDLKFAEKIRNGVDAVLIDEFQDTDHVQWTIFSRLFLNGKKPLYLIGDPKQSIYRFRGADIYTYLQAKNSFPKDAHFTLNRNFRSTPDLVVALNHFFSLRNPFFTLPKTGEALVCPQMESDPKNAVTLKEDGKGSIHIWDGDEESDFFPCIVDEIRALSKDWNIPLSECAVLVKDRHQADRFQKYARSRDLHAVTKRSRPITSGLAYKALVELLEGLMHLKQKGTLQKICGGAIFAYSSEKIQSQQEAAFLLIMALKEKLEKEGILAFFRMLMESLYEEILSREEGVSFYSDLMQLVEILAENVERQEGYLSLLLSFLHNLTTLSEDSELVQAYAVGLEEMVPILTIHGSKGLEFEVVFSLGTMLSSQSKKELVYDSEKGVYTLAKEAFLREQKESEVEKIRLFYVAATRAKKRLYLTYLSKEVHSPLNLFLGESKLGNVSQITRSPCIRRSMSSKAEWTPLKQLKAPQPVSLAFSLSSVTSFSRLALEVKELIPKKSSPIQNPSLLPLGTETGNILHKILEILPFEQAFLCKSPELLSNYVRPFLEKNGYADYEMEILNLVFSAIHVPLPISLSLSSLDPKKILKESEFLYPTSEGYLKGFIDLLFEHEKKIYVIDWKSNFLEDYAQESLKQAMHANAYDLQEKIYREAASRYGKQFGVTYGGTFFIFLRGLNTQSRGIHFIEN